MATPLLPDPGEAFRLFASAQPELAALVGTRVSTKLGGAAAAIRYAVLSGAAGYDEASPGLQVECWGPGGAGDDGTASRIARTVLAVLPRMRGEYGEGWVAGAVADGHPFDAPDPTTERPRQIVTVRLLTYA